MRPYYRPGATPFEQLEGLVAFSLCFKPEIPPRVADLLVWVSGSGPSRERAIQELFPSGCIADRAEALGMARAVLLLCGVVPERAPQLTGQPRADLNHLFRGGFGHPDLASPESYALPSLVEVYCHMGAGFARGVDRVFGAVTGRPLAEHLRRSLTLLPPSISCEASSS